MDINQWQNHVIELKMPASDKNFIQSVKVSSEYKNPLEVVFEDISTFNGENPIVGSLLTELDVKKKVLASDLIKDVPNALGKILRLKKD